MSRLLSLAALAAAAALAGCDPPPPPTCVPSGQRAVVFFDRSASANGDATSEAAFTDALQTLVDSSFTCQGDQIDGYLLFSNTGTAYHENLAVLTEPVDVARLADLDRDGASTRWARAMDQERDDVVVLFQKKLVGLDGIPPEARQETDILGSLRLLEDAFEGTPDSLARRVLYLSDMRESKRATGRRDFDVRPPSDVVQARAWADEDVARLVEQGEVSADALAGIEVTVVRSTLGITDGRRDDADAVRAYWQEVFGRLGAARVAFP